MRRQLARLGRAVALPTAERADLVRAQWALILARLELRTRRTGTLVRRATPDRTDTDVAADADAADADVVADATLADTDRALALELAVRRAAAYGPLRTTCLLRATALQRLLEREGIRHSRLRVGVRRAGNHFAAHAWVELGNVVLGDQPEHVRTFTPTDLRLVRR
ncbi:MAG: lasso peptide biosynthesis B2 protein [Gemmatimonadaceae bacterium]